MIILKIYEIYDAAGERNERKKWFHVMPNTDVLLYVVNLQGYAKNLSETLRHNRLKEEYHICKKSINMKQIRNTKFVVLLNKFNLFIEDINVYNLSKEFYDFRGDNRSSKQVLEYIVEMFLSAIPDNRSNENIPFIAINAMSTDCIKNMFDFVRNDVIYSNYLNS